MSTNNSKIESYCAVISPSWVNGSLAVTHDPLTHFNLCYRALNLRFGVEILSVPVTVSEI